MIEFYNQKPVANGLTIFIEGIMDKPQEIINAISKHFPNHTWLQRVLAELDLEVMEVKADRNRLLKELSRARNEIYRLRAGLG